MEEQDLFGCHHMALAEGQLCFSWCIETCFAVFLAWGAVLTLKLRMHKGNGDLSFLLVLQQYLFVLILRRGLVH